LAALLRRQGIPFVLAVYPYGHQVDGREWESGRVDWGFQRGTVSTGTAFAFLHDVGRHHGIPVLDSLQAFRESRVFPKFLSHDGHFTAAGHVVYAEALMQEMEAKGLLSLLARAHGIQEPAGGAGPAPGARVPSAPTGR
jgi:hypothetical protein